MSKDYDDWMKELDGEDKAHKEYRLRAQKVVERYEDEEKREDSQFNILWSNVEVLHSALYAKSPSPDIRRRYLDTDKDGKQASELAERAVTHCLDVYDFDGVIDECIDDNLIAGMGIPRIRYKPYYKTMPGDPVYLEERPGGLDLDMVMQTAMFNGEERVDDYLQDDQGFAYIEGEEKEEVVYEEAYAEPVNWKRFRWQPAARWEGVDWCAIEHYMDEDELEENYGKEHAKKIPMNYKEDGSKATDEDDKARALVYEIFDKKARQNIELADGYHELLKVTDDPLKLEGYYPFPKPLFNTTKNGKLIPIPDYLFYQDQAQELDRVTERISALTEQLKYRGMYDASFKDLAGLQNADDGTFLPVDDFQALTGGQGQGDLRKVIAVMPTDDIRAALNELYAAREQIKQTIYEITGIADIMRGSTAASETLGAQQLKTQFGSMRMAKRQRRVAHFIRDVIRIKVEVMVENFQPQTLEMMTGVEMTPEVYQILTNDLMRSYRIDIETDSTIAEDAQTEKQNRIEFVTAITGFFEKVGPMVQAGLVPPQVATELLGFAVRGFKVGRTLEDTLDEMSEQGGEDPQMQLMHQEMQQKTQEMEQQLQEYVGQMQEMHGKEKQQLEGKVFDLEKKLAIINAVNPAKMFETQTKNEIEKSTKQYSAELNMLMEIFRTQMTDQQRQPMERIDNLGEVIQQIAQAIQAIDQKVVDQTDGFQKQIDETRGSVAEMASMMKKPVKVIRDKRGRISGATRD